MKIYLGQDLHKENTYWPLRNKNSLALTGLSGNGKSYLLGQMIEQFERLGFDITVISDKVLVDFKQPYLKKIDPLNNLEKLEQFVDQTAKEFKLRKELVENSQYTHIQDVDSSLKPQLLILDETWALAFIDDKEIRKNFFNLIELLIRQGRFLNMFLIVCTQVGKVSETEISLRQCSILITGKTDTAEMSKSLLGNDDAYSVPLKTGMFIYFDRGSKPKIIKVVPEKISILQKIKRLL